MNKKELLTMLEYRAREYKAECSDSILRNNHMNSLTLCSKMPSQRVIDAILVDFINYVGASQGLDYRLYTKHLRRKK